jgi:hypothetical protein
VSAPEPLPLPIDHGSRQHGLLRIICVVEYSGLSMMSGSIPSVTCPRANKTLETRTSLFGRLSTVAGRTSLSGA